MNMNRSGSVGNLRYVGFKRSPSGSDLGYACVTQFNRDGLEATTNKALEESKLEYLGLNKSQLEAVYPGASIYKKDPNEKLNGPSVLPYTEDYT